MRFTVCVIVVLLAAVVSVGAARAEDCHYKFVAGQGLIDSCTGEKASNSSARGGGPAIVTGPQCHPSYSVCLKPDAVDYDCLGGPGDGPLYIKGPFDVIGPDDFGLDGRDYDGIACEEGE